MKELADQRGDRLVRQANRNDTETVVHQSRQKLGLVFSTARHDINNQLTVLNGYLSLLETPGTAMKTSEILRILQGATARIDHILAFTREFQNIGENPPVWQVLGETIRHETTDMETGAVRIIPDPSCDEVEVFADPLLGKVFSNLIDNSLRHGEKVSAIQIHCSSVNNALRIVCEDNGIGIPVRIRPLLFEPGKGKNTGYGLFLVREILSVTGITISEQGAAGKGARFEIVVPSGSFRVTGRR